MLFVKSKLTRLRLFFFRIRCKLKYTFGVCPDCARRFFVGDHSGHIPF